MNVLLVSALSDLKSVNAEIEGIVNSGLTVQLLRDATVARLADYAKSKQIDIIWFATHGVDADPLRGQQEPGVILADGVFGASSIGQIVRANGITKVVLNTCDSIAVALAIVDHTQADIVCTVGQIGDSTAALTGRTFAEMLHKHGNFRYAYEQSKPAGNTNYIYLSAFRQETGDQSEISVSLDKWGKILEGRIADIDHRLTQVENGLRGRVSALDNRLAVQLVELDKKIDSKYHPQLTRKQGTSWMIGYILFGLAVLVTPSIWRYRLDTVEGWVVGAVCYLVAAHFFVQGLGFRWTNRGKTIT